MKEQIISIALDGTLTCIHDDDVAETLRGVGEATTSRASHVEPDGKGGWMVDLQPVGGPVVFSFARRDEALAYEIRWIQENVL